MGRMSYRDRLERMAAEKAAAEKERQEKAAKRRAERSTRSSASAPDPAVRTRIVWAVCNHMGDPVKTFSYPEKEAADAEAARLTEEKETRHYVSKQKVPME